MSDYQEIYNKSNINRLIDADETGLKELFGDIWDDEFDSAFKRRFKSTMTLIALYCEDDDESIFKQNLQRKSQIMLRGLGDFLRLQEKAKFYQSFENHLNFLNNQLLFDVGYHKSVIADLVFGICALPLDNPYRNSDVYLWAITYRNENPLPTLKEILKPVEPTPISKTESTFTWTHNTKGLEDVLSLFEAVSHLFEENGLNGFKMAVSGKEIEEVDFGCITPSDENKTYVTYLFFKLLEAGYIGNYRDTDRDGLWEHLIGSSTTRKFRHYYSDFKQQSTNLKKDKSQLIDEVIDAI